jgi:hypothetical protein
LFALPSHLVEHFVDRLSPQHYPGNSAVSFDAEHGLPKEVAFHIGVVGTLPRHNPIKLLFKTRPPRFVNAREILE